MAFSTRLLRAFYKMPNLSIIIIFMLFSMLIKAQSLPQATIIKDLKIGNSNSSPRNFVTLGNKVFFKANSETDINQPSRLLVSDGTEGGTNIAPFLPLNYSSISSPVVLNGQLYFGLNQNGFITLWRSVDGVTASVVDTVWRPTNQINIIMDDESVYTNGNNIYIKVRHSLSNSNADYEVDLYRSNGQTHNINKVGIVGSSYQFGKTSASQVFHGINTTYFVNNYYVTSNNYQGVEFSIGNNVPLISYTWISNQPATKGLLGIGVINDDFIGINTDTLVRINALGQNVTLMTNLKNFNKLGQIGTTIYFIGQNGYYKTDGTVAGTKLIVSSTMPTSDVKPYLAGRPHVIKDTLFVEGYTDNFYGIWKIDNAMSNFKRILNIEAPKPYLVLIVLNNKAYLTEKSGTKTTLYEPNFSINKIKPIGQLDRFDYDRYYRSTNFTSINNFLIAAAGDDDATIVTPNAKGIELRKLSLTPSLLAFPCLSDTTRPVFYSCPNNITFTKYNLSPSWCYFETIPRPNAYDLCNIPITGVTAQKGTFLPESDWKNGEPYYTYCLLGVDTVTYWARDLAYNITKCSFKVTVVAPDPCSTDALPPVFSKCPTDTIINNNKLTIVNWTSPAVTDNCGIPSLALNFPSGSTFPVGITKVIYTATDAKNNSSSCNFTITVTQQAVSGDVCANPTANITTGANALTVSGITTSFAVIQIFTSGWIPVYNQQVSTSSATIPNLTAGNYIVKVSVLGVGGKWPAVCTVQVNNVVVSAGTNPCITDITPPVFSKCPTNINLTTTGTTAIATWTAPTAIDNCTATPSVSSTYNSGFTFPVGTTNVVYTAEDVKANKSVCSFNVVVISQPTNANDIAISISATPTVFKKWTTNIFRIEVKNLGNQAFTNIQINAPAPQGTSGGGTATSSLGTWQSYCAGGIACYKWTIPTLSANATATLEIPYFILNVDTPLIATARLVTSTPADGNATNNQESVTVSPASAQQAQLLSLYKPTQLIPIVIQQISPNPTEGEIIIAVESLIERDIRFDFYSTLGKNVYKETQHVKKGQNALYFNLTDKQGGVYFVKPEMGGGHNVPMKFVKL